MSYSKSQCQQVLEHLQNNGSITALTAIQAYGITRLASRIYDLRDRGHKIKDESIKVVNRYGKFVYVTRYTLQVDVKAKKSYPLYVFGA